MKSLVLATVFVSVSAFACPDLSGTYATCRSVSAGTAGSSDVIVTQSVSNGVTTYTMTSTDNETQERSTESIVADGIARTQTLNEQGLEFLVTEKNSCSGNALLMTQSMSYQGEEVVSVNMTATKSGRTLTMEINGSALGQQVTDTMICD